MAAQACRSCQVHGAAPDPHHGLGNATWQRTLCRKPATGAFRFPISLWMDVVTIGNRDKPRGLPWRARPGGMLNIALSPARGDAYDLGGDEAHSISSGGETRAATQTGARGMP